MRNLADATNVGDARSLALAFARSRPLSAPKRGARESPTSPATKKIQITHLKMRAVEEERRVPRLGSRVERKEKNCREKRSERRQSDFGEKPSSRERSAREGEEREKKLIFFPLLPSSAFSSRFHLCFHPPTPCALPPPLLCRPEQSASSTTPRPRDGQPTATLSRHGRGPTALQR